MATGPSGGNPPVSQGGAVFTEPVQGALFVNGTIAEYVNNNVFVPSTGDTISAGTPPSAVVLVNPGAAITGAILAPGVVDGQCITIINIAAAANTITFAAKATSNVAVGTGAVLKGLFAMSFTWSASQAAWFNSANS